MRISVIDLGSNSARMSIFEKQPGGVPKTLASYRKATGLSKGMTEDMTLKAEGQMCAISALLDFRKINDEWAPQKTIAVATAAVRKAKNRDEFLNLVKDTCGLEIEVIDGQREAALDALAINQILGCSRGVICDIGGGSTELVGLGGADESVSIPYGSRGITEMFFEHGETKEARMKAESFVTKILEKEKWLDKFKGTDIVGIGGTLRAMAKLCLGDAESKPIDKCSISTKDFNVLIDKVFKASAEERRAMPGIGEERAKIISGGLAIFMAIEKKVAPGNILVADIGVREGVAIDFFEKI